MITHLVAPETFDGDRVIIEGDAYRHLFRARRLAQGAPLRIVDGAGRARSGTIDHIERKRATVELGDPLPSHEAGRNLRLVVAPLRPERASWLVEKATELGVVSIHFVRTERTPRTYGDGFRQRLLRVAAAAVAQCHRALVPEITGVDPWDTMEALLQRFGTAERLLLDPTASARLTAADAERPGAETPRDGVAVIGPEGGWSAAELRQLDDWECRGVTLGERILRVETAAVAIAARWLA